MLSTECRLAWTRSPALGAGNRRFGTKLINKLAMNYARIYYRIIENRLIHPFDGYTESHHIIPKSLGGSDSKDNLVRLSAREHFVCHWLLVKMYKTSKRSYYKMLRALNMMCSCMNKNQQRYHSYSRIFARYREDFSKAMSALQVGKKNSQSGTMWVSNIELKKNKKIPKGTVPEGWVMGRNKWKAKRPRPASQKPNKPKMYQNGFPVSVDGQRYDSISHAADCLKIGHETARMRFKSPNFPSYVILSRV